MGDEQRDIPGGMRKKAKKGKKRETSFGGEKSMGRTAVL